MTTQDRLQVWRPRVAGVAEVLHAEWRTHFYPAHTHSTWTLMLVDDGLIGYQLDRRVHTARPRSGVTLLPPDVVHDGGPATSHGFRKRVVYLEGDVFARSVIGSAVDGPLILDDQLRVATSRLDRALITDEDLEAESRLALVVERLAWHLAGRRRAPKQQRPAVVARRAREVLDGDPMAAGGLTDVAAAIGVSVPHLVRSFARSYGIAPHQYLLGRRLDLARRRLLTGQRACDVAVATGFHDQSHLTRHFKRLLSVTPGQYQASGG